MADLSDDHVADLARLGDDATRACEICERELAEGFETVRVDGDDEPLWQRTEGGIIIPRKNVPPLVTEQKYRPLFDAVVERANAAGFTVTATVLDAVHYGVPQFRRRAFVVGTRGEASRRPFGFPLPTNWNFVARPGEPARRGRIHGGRWVKDPSKAEFDVEVDEVDEDDAQLELLPTRSP